MRAAGVVGDTVAVGVKKKGDRIGVRGGEVGRRLDGTVAVCEAVLLRVAIGVANCGSLASLSLLLSSSDRS